MQRAFCATCQTTVEVFTNDKNEIMCKNQHKINIADVTCSSCKGQDKACKLMTRTEFNPFYGVYNDVEARICPDCEPSFSSELPNSISNLTDVKDMYK